MGEAKAIENVEKVLGNAVKTLKDPNLAAIFIGIVLGLILGSIPVSYTHLSSPRTSVARFSCPNHLHLDFAATYLQYPNTFGAFIRRRHKSLVVGQPIPAA